MTEESFLRSGRLALDTEFVKDHIHHLRVVAHGVVRTLHFLVCLLVGQEVAIKC